jgi:hypothetical protein
MASAGPPLGTQLGQLGVNIANFVKDFNLRTSIYRYNAVPYFGGCLHLRDVQLNSEKREGTD